ncbi:glycosyltransferase family protein [Advenella mimigardefordensis]|uniref:Putative glycosyltransferase n=1 Tax=Advenella mimigardefordensis (strain DSM 17166 / LMG 22922 / DPN7) TaxID=1247726 RepID=W0PJV6_ADVMD|nr:glycosyltransferase [Advenella mimigardefordensis]AHG65835.1 putative glycosyltransferase [Advenella mimigardefordensis DPN7]
MMDISEQDDNQNKELQIVRLEYELKRFEQAQQVNESLWLEKETSLNSIISEQKKVISLLESLLKSNQQMLDTAQISYAKQDEQFNLLSEQVSHSLDQTGEQVEILKQTAIRAEQLLLQKDIELNGCKNRLESLVQEVKKLEKFNEESSKANNLAIEREEHLQGLIVQLREKETNLSKIYERALADKESFAKELETARTEIATGHAQQAAFNDLQRRYETLCISHDSLQALSKEYEDKTDRLQLVVDEQQSTMSNLRSTNARFQTEITSQLEKNRALSLESKSLIDKLSVLKAQNQELESRLEAALERVHVVEENKNKLDLELEKIRVKMNGLSAREIRYKQQIAEFDDKFVEAQDKLRGTISFQLGYAILQAGKSLHGLFHLPTALFKIRKVAKQRKLSKQFKFEKVSPSTKTNRESVNLTPLATVDLKDFNSPVTESQERQLKIAGVMDEFTYHSFAPEANILQLHPDNWEQQLVEFQPDLLFIESAWQGLDGLWKTKISNAKEEIQSAVKWCNLNNVPTMFWNKEDPVHFGTFLPIACMVDFVFTTDIDCIPKYKQRVGHTNVFLLPFAAQPKTHNPIEKFERKDAFNFAGSYYLRYPERQRDFGSLIDTVRQFKGVEIYDRNFDNPHPHYTFPEKYKTFILGKLPFSEIDKAYKGYRYGINMNTIKQSQTMFARRVFELLASNTVVVSNFSRGVRLLFGDLVVSSDNPLQLREGLESVCRDEGMYRKFRLLGLRKVFGEHTYAHRLAYIRAKLSGKQYISSRSKIFVLAAIRSINDYEMVKAGFDRQRYEGKSLVVVAPSHDLAAQLASIDVIVLSSQDQFVTALNEMNANDWISVFSPDDYYGPNYLNDLELATGYSNAEVIGKLSYYSASEVTAQLVNDGKQYSRVSELSARRAIIRRSQLTDALVNGLFSAPEELVLRNANMLAIDEFNYCQHLPFPYSQVLMDLVNDMTVSDTGVSYLNQLVSVSESLPPASGEKSPTEISSGPGLSGAQLFEFIPEPATSAIKFGRQGDSFNINSKLATGKHVYVYTKRNFRREELNLVLNSQFKLECDGTLDTMTVFEFQDKDGKKIAHSMNKIGDHHALAIPEHCVYVRFGMKLLSAGRLSISRLVLGTANETPYAVIGKSNNLVVSKQYPDYDDLYKYGFVHSRLRRYRTAGLVSDVFRVAGKVTNHYREFEGIDVASGDHALLHATLKTGQFRKVLIHILDDKIWDVVKDYLENTKIFIWVHGSEIQHWKRRSFEFKNMSADEVKRQKTPVR